MVSKEVLIKFAEVLRLYAKALKLVSRKGVEPGEIQGESSKKRSKG